MCRLQPESTTTPQLSSHDPSLPIQNPKQPNPTPKRNTTQSHHHNQFRYLAGFAVGVPVFVIKRYAQSRLALEWRAWLTQRLLSQYFRDRSFYQLQAGGLVDNPDQRIAADVR